MSAQKSGERRRLAMIEAGLALARQHGFTRVSRSMVARKVGCSDSLLSSWWTAEQFQSEVMYEAVDRGMLDIIAQGLVARHPAAINAPFCLRSRAAEYIAGGEEHA